MIGRGIPWLFVGRVGMEVNWDLVINNLPLARAVAASHTTSRVTIDELVWGVGLNTLIKCSRTWRVDGEAKFTTYAWGSLHKAMSKFVTKYRFLSLDAESFAEIVDPSTPLNTVSHDAYSILEKLDLFDRLLLMMRYWQGMTMPEIAEQLGCSKVSVHKYLGEAIERCQQVVNHDALKWYASKRSPAQVPREQTP